MPVSDWRVSVAEKLAELLALPAGWNSYGSAPISQETTQRAMTVLEAVMQDSTPPPSVVPINDSGVQLEWHCRSMDIEVEVSPGDPVEVYAEDHRGEWVREFSLSGDFAPLGRILAELSRRP